MSIAPALELWRSRALLSSLVLRELRLRYAGSSVGLLWAIVGPLLQLLILTTVFSLVLQIRLGSDPSVPFAVTLAWGFLPWLALQDGIGRATTVLVEEGVLVRRMAFRPEIVLARPIFAAVVQEVIGLCLLVVLMPLLGARPGLGILLCVLPLVVQVLLGLGIGWILGVLHVYFRDTAQVVGAGLQAWFYLTPIVYTLDIAPAGLRWILALNPLCGVVESFRAFAVGGPVSWAGLAYSGVCAIALLALGAFLVERSRAEVPDLV